MSHWTKTGPLSTIGLERRIYEALGPHPHIVLYRKGELILQRLSKGIYTHLFENDPPFRTRIRRAAQISHAVGKGAPVVTSFGATTMLGICSLQTRGMMLQFAI
jgi:hypothetical protein